jgi:hypothetical protein
LLELSDNVVTLSAVGSALFLSLDVIRPLEKIRTRQAHVVEAHFAELLPQEQTGALETVTGGENGQSTVSLTGIYSGHTCEGQTRTAKAKMLSRG